MPLISQWHSGSPGGTFDDAKKTESVTPSKKALLVPILVIADAHSGLVSIVVPEKSTES
jgi:hypothetical protein